MDKNSSIGVFDSGMGGLYVLAEAYKLMPNENFIFYGDNKHAPYGTKDESYVLKRCEEISELLIAKGCKAMLIACNTATSIAATTLRNRYSIPIIGMEPALKPAYKDNNNNKIVVIATKNTIKLDKFNILMKKYGKNAIAIDAGRLVDFLESNNANINAIKDYIHSIMKEHENNTDSIVLGCTHFSFYRKLILNMYPKIKIYDGAQGTVKQLKRVLQDENLLSDKKVGRIELLSSIEDNDMHMRMKQLLNNALNNKDYYEVYNERE